MKPIVGHALNFDVENALSAGGIGTWDWDLLTDRMRWSAQMSVNMGVPAGKRRCRYRHLLQAIHPADRERVAEEFADCRKRAGPMRVEAQLAPSDDGPRWAVFLGRTEAGPDASPVRMLGITIDSTRRRRNEEASAAALLESERQLRATNERLQALTERRHRQFGASRAQMQAIFDNSPDWLTLFRATADGHFVYIDLNKATARAYNLPYENVVGRTVEEILGPEQAALPLSLMRECLRTGENQRYSARRTIGGDTRLIDVMFVRVPEQLNGDYHIMATARDTTERDEMVEQLRRERLLFELIIENTSDGIIVVDQEFRHLVWNPAIARVNGLPASAVLGRTVFEAFPQFIDHPVGHAWREALAGRHAEMRDYRFFSAARGSEIIYDADFTPLYDRDRSIIGAICILHETTERHRMENLAKLETVAQLTGGVAHDFNNLLTSAMGGLDLILRADGSAHISSLAEASLRALDRGARLTQQLLAFARRQPLRPVAADLNVLLTEIAVLIRRAVGETIGVTIDLAPDLPRCRVDPAQFEAAVMNLVLNARDATPDGGHLRIMTGVAGSERRAGDCELPLGEYVAFTVEDDGRGMTPEVAARAMEPFYTTKDAGKGSGLGLSTVYGFAKQLGGELCIESAWGCGTRATLYLPLATTTEADARPGAAPDRLRPGAGTILVVEDDASVRETSVEMLEGLGYRVLIAASGEEALVALHAERSVDLVFSDLIMPGGISGVELARQAREARPELPVLLTTGYAGREEMTGEFPVLHKPFRLVDLSTTVAALIEAVQRSRAIGRA